MSMDAQDGNIDGIENLGMEEVAASEHPYGEVTAEDLSTEELVYDGADPAFTDPDDPALPVDEALHDDEPGDETIEDRLAQEEPDPSSQVVHDAPRRSAIPTDPRTRKP